MKKISSSLLLLYSRIKDQIISEFYIFEYFFVVMVKGKKGVARPENPNLVTDGFFKKVINNVSQHITFLFSSMVANIASLLLCLLSLRFRFHYVDTENFLLYHVVTSLSKLVSSISSKISSFLSTTDTMVIKKNISFLLQQINGEWYQNGQITTVID